ncbi:MAG: L-rhamnose mutarotase [Rhizobiales bacterium]|nr:L-rhamnose mutarotase [Hyphomicrobiales bacterium]NRB14339.1 L-rhamnose mutarotase [Hyphomicrobiales bacterium]
MKRYASIIGINENDIAEYKRLHANVWPEILDRLSKSNITNYSIFLKQPENLLFSYYEYLGTDHKSDQDAIAKDTKTQKWWAICGPKQNALASRAEGEWWASLEEVFHLD